MLYEMLTSCLHFREGETHTTEELAGAGCDLNWLLKANAIRPVGFLASNPERTDLEQAQIVAELQKKLELAEHENDTLRQEARDAAKRVRVLEEGHRVGSAQLAQAVSEREQLAAELKRLQNGGSVG